MQIDFEQEKGCWNAKAIREERDIADEVINRLLRWREVERHLQGVSAILDIGAATGAFSIPLAKRGKFYHPDAVFSFPVYLEPDVNDFMSKLAEEKDIDVQELVNEWLRANIKWILSVQQRS